mmetsp:Transcript_67974/g.114214  ORF Transcript_67974/g.114214 Transcript_67974/m.114214 type:complete len:326 (-) Transcript_67974:117-1094(-)
MELADLDGGVHGRQRHVHYGPQHRPHVRPHHLQRLVRVHAAGQRLPIDRTEVGEVLQLPGLDGVHAQTAELVQDTEVHDVLHRLLLAHLLHLVDPLIQRDLRLVHIGGDRGRGLALLLAQQLDLSRHGLLEQVRSVLEDEVQELPRGRLGRQQGLELHRQPLVAVRRGRTEGHAVACAGPHHRARGGLPGACCHCHSWSPAPCPQVREHTCQHGRDADECEQVQQCRLTHCGLGGVPRRMDWPRCRGSHVWDTCQGRGKWCGGGVQGSAVPGGCGIPHIPGQGLDPGLRDGSGGVGLTAKARGGAVGSEEGESTDCRRGHRTGDA